MGGDIRYFLRKTKIINVNLRGNMEKIKEEDILLFFNKSTKNDNDSVNKTREYIILCLCNSKIPPHWFLDSPNSDKWNILNTELFNFIDSIKPNNGVFIGALHMAGRKNNYDFIFQFTSGNVKVEFKYGAQEISDCPQFLSVSSNNFITPGSPDYAEFFYDNYIPKIIESYESIFNEPLLIPSKGYYMKNIYKDKVPNPFFIQLKNGEENPEFKKIKNELTTKSIDDFLTNHLKLDFILLETKIKESQDNKIYMLWDKETFNKSELFSSEIIPKFEIKNNGTKGANTIIVKTFNDSEYHMLLRWKNHRGILYPAWQISVKI